MQRKVSPDDNMDSLVATIDDISKAGDEFSDYHITGFRRQFKYECDGGGERSQRNYPFHVDIGKTVSESHFYGP
jgi:hypothetical protein